MRQRAPHRVGCRGSAKGTALPGVLPVAAWKAGGCHGRQDNVGLLSAIVWDALVWPVEIWAILVHPCRKNGKPSIFCNHGLIPLSSHLLCPCTTKRRWSRCFGQRLSS